MIAGINGPAVVVSAQTAFILDKRLGAELSRLRVTARGRIPQVAQELLELREAAMRFDPERSAGPELEPDFEALTGQSDQWLTPLGVADLLGITDRAVRKACETGRLDAEQDNRRHWHIRRSAVENFARTRNAAGEK